MNLKKAAQRANEDISQLKCGGCQAELEIKEICLTIGVVTFGCSWIEKPEDGHDWVTIDFYSFIPPLKS